MKTYIVDANVLMSMLISGKAIYRTLLREYVFLSSDFAFIEIDKYQEVILQKAKLDSDSFKHFSYFLFSNLHFLPNYVIDGNVKQKAIALASDIDIKDVAYVALSMQLDITLLTRDQTLHDGLRKKGFRKIQMFDDFLRNA
ncbi:MAG: PIN domain-containing protein [Emticicia sp.]|nr:PIN domain-containing protein [Emticicia sp.]